MGKCNSVCMCRGQLGAKLQVRTPLKLGKLGAALPFQSVSLCVARRWRRLGLLVSLGRALGSDLLLAVVALGRTRIALTHRPSVTVRRLGDPAVRDG